MIRRTALLAVLIALLASPHAYGQRRDERLTGQLLQGLPSNSSRPLTTLSPAEAARQAQSEHGGEVLAVDGLSSGYRVKLLVNGEVKIVHIQR